MLQSWFSLTSVFSRASSGSKSREIHKDSDNASNSSYRAFVPRDGFGKVATEIYPMTDIEAQQPVSASRISVRNDITQTSRTH